MAGTLQIALTDLSSSTNNDWKNAFTNALNRSASRIAQTNTAILSDSKGAALHLIMIDYNTKQETINEACKEHDRCVIVLLTPCKINVADLNANSTSFHHFYELNENTKQPVTLDIHDHEEEFWFKVVDLTYDICGIDRSIDHQLKAEVFLAETGSDLVPMRAQLKAELESRNITVHSRFPLPYTDEPLLNTLNSFIGLSACSIHLIGGHYDQSLGEDEPKFIRQLKLVMEKYPDLYQLIWIDPNRERTDLQQEAFIESVKRMARDNFKGEIIEAPLENFKTILISRIWALQQIKSSPLFDEAGKKRLYLIHDLDNKDSAESIIQRLRDSGFDAVGSDVNATDIEHIENHRRKLIECDVVMILDNHYHPWLRSMIKDIRKIPGLGRTKPLEKKCLITNNDGSLSDAELIGMEVFKNEGEYKDLPVQELLNQIA